MITDEYTGHILQGRRWHRPDCASFGEADADMGQPACNCDELESEADDEQESLAAELPTI